MKLERIKGVLFLKINDDLSVKFKDEWVELLRTLPYYEFGVFMRDTIYPTLTDKRVKSGIAAKLVTTIFMLQSRSISINLKAVTENQACQVGKCDPF